VGALAISAGRAYGGLGSLQGSRTRRVIAASEQDCSEVRSGIRQREPDVVFGLAGSGEVQRRKWQRFTSVPKLQKYWDSNRPGDAAFVWVRGHELIAVQLTLQDDSADWVNRALYCFREGDTTAQITSELRTFYGQMIVRRKWILNAEGHVLRATEEFLDLSTEKPKRPDESFTDQKTPIYRKVADFPFYPILRGNHP